LGTLSALEKQQPWPGNEALFSPPIQSTLESAWSFLASVRCFLHFSSARDDNILTWDAQDEAAAQKLGAPGVNCKTSAEWMRLYFGHAGAIDRIANRLL
jgi:[protein-PII] uridylyltransferase